MKIPSRLLSSTQIKRSTTPPIATTTEFTVEQKTGYAILRLNRAPVNSLSLEFLTAFGIELDKIEDNKSINGVILTSVLLLAYFLLQKNDLLI